MEKMTPQDIRETNHNPDSDYGIITSPDIKLHSNPKPRAWIEDNFYEDPDLVREFGLLQTFWEGDHGGAGWRTRTQFIFDGVKEKIERIIGMKITNWAETYEICGVFQVGFTQGTKYSPARVFHCDRQKYAAMVYLSPDAPPEMGTKIFRNKETKKFDSEEIDHLNEIFPNQETFCDPTPFEEIDSFGNVYNRIVIFDGHCIHSSSGYFGNTFNNGRLWQMFFFDAE
jgi:hypothetical protein